MILYEWVYNHGKIAKGVFCSEDCAKNMYFDNPKTCYKGGPSPLDEQESEELAVDWETCYGCGKPFEFSLRKIEDAESVECKFLQQAADITHVLIKEKNIQRCPDCDGCGERPTGSIISGDTLTIESNGEQIKIVCPTCRGTGKTPNPNPGDKQ